MRIFFGGLIILLFVNSCGTDTSENQHFEINEKDFLRDIPVYADDRLVNVIVEIPAGCNQKWEVNKETGFLDWETAGNDSLREIKYLPYPANYGMIPGTLLAEEDGGDNDPLDVFLLGPSLRRGTVMPARIVGIVFIKDKQEQDDKLIAVQTDSWFYKVHSLDDLNRYFPGITDILVQWLINYKGPGIVIFEGFGDEYEANKVLEKAIQGFEKI